MVRDAVEAAIDVEQRSRGNKELTRAEKEAVMRSVVDQRVMLDKWFGDEARPAIAVTGDDRDVAYVPLEQIPQAALNQWVNVIRSEVPREQRSSREQILSRYRSRIERAHAAAALGMGADEERRRLLGQ